MFGLTPKARHKLAVKHGVDASGSLTCASVSDYAWTESVRRDFYAHEYHKRMLSRSSRWSRMDLSFWQLNSEPACVADDFKIVVQR